jgi:hypothetical protein
VQSLVDDDGDEANNEEDEIETTSWLVATILSPPSWVPTTEGNNKYAGSEEKVDTALACVDIDEEKEEEDEDVGFEDDVSLGSNWSESNSSESCRSFWYFKVFSKAIFHTVFGSSRWMYEISPGSNLITKITLIIITKCRKLKHLRPHWQKK